MTEKKVREGRRKLMLREVYDNPGKPTHYSFVEGRMLHWPVIDLLWPQRHSDPRPSHAGQIATFSTGSEHTAPDPTTTLPEPAQVSQILRAPGVLLVTGVFPEEKLFVSDGPSGDSCFSHPARKRANLVKRSSHVESGDDSGRGGSLSDI